MKEITGWYEVENMRFCPMITKYLFNHSRDNIGTYILLNDRSVLVCDEYGRTFLISVKVSINDIVNTLIEAGYTRTPNPEYYVKEVIKAESDEE